jgi:iron complex outermembrane receptor protein
MSKIKKAQMALMYGALAIAPFAAPVEAQAQTASATEGGDEIVVTARRREESLQDVPIAVSTFSAEQLDNIGAADITTLQQTTPNLTLQVARGSNSTLIAFIRGVGQQDPLWGFEPGVGLYIDDVYVARPQGAVLDIFDIERIEVLRGPQGTLYGRNTIGGAVKYVTAKIRGEPEYKIKANIGAYQQTDLILSGAGEANDGLAFSGAVALYGRDGYGKNLTTGAEHYNKDVAAFRGTAEWSPTDDLFFRFSADYTRDKSNARHGHREIPGIGLTTGATVLPDVYDTRAGIGDKNNVETQGYSFTGEWNMSPEWTVKSVTAYREGNTETLIDFDTEPAAALDVPAFYRDNQFTQELQLQYNGERIQAVGGLFYLNAVAEGAFDTVLGIANLAILTSGKVSTTSFAAYGDVSFDITDQLSVSVGGRWTQDDKDGQVFRVNYSVPLGTPANLIRSPRFGNPAAIPGLLRTNYKNAKSFEEFTPRLSASYEISDDLTLYASWGKGFKSGGFDMRGDAIFFPGTVNGYEPEIVETYEIGAKGSFLDGALTLNAAIFQSDYTDQQVTSQFAIPGTPPTVVSFVDNVGSSEILGFEVEGNFIIDDNWSGVFQVGYIDAQFNEFFTLNPTTLVIENRANILNFQNTPRYSSAFALSYQTDLAEGWGSLNVTPMVSYRSKYQLFETPNAQLDQKEYNLLDLSAVWNSDDGRVKVGLHGKNLQDERYRVGGYAFPGATFGNSVNGFYGPPRTWTLSAEVKF